MAAATASLTVSARPSSFRGPSARKTFGAKSTRSIRASGQFKVGCLPDYSIASAALFSWQPTQRGVRCSINP